MTRPNNLCVLLSIIWGVALIRPAEASDCLLGNDFPWGTRSVDLYVHYDPSGSGTGQGIRYAIANGSNSLTESDIESAVIRVTTILNEEVGGRIKLNYAGTTTSSSTRDNAIVLVASDCSNASGVAAAGQRYQSLFGSVYGKITLYRNYGTACTAIPWRVAETDPTDLVAILMHELGHSFYAMDHPDERPDCDWTTGEPSIMTSDTGQFPYPRTRQLRDWDRLHFQQVHGVRALDGRLYKDYRNPTSWGSAGATAAADGSGFLYRPGSAPQGVPIRNIGYLHHFSSSTPQLYGRGTPSNGRYNLAGFAAQTLTAAGHLFRPVATASRPGTNEVLVAYIKDYYGYSNQNSDVGQVCYRISTNTGVTFGTEVCGNDWISGDWLSYRNGLTAAYSVRSNVYLLGFVDHNDNVAIGVVPASGSGALGALWHQTGSSWHAPALACNGNANDPQGCLMVWEDKTNNGCRNTVAFDVYPTWGSIIMGTVSNTPCFSLYDTPGLAYSPADGGFVMTFTSKNNAIYSYRYSAGSWVGYGDVWNDSSSWVLSAVLGYRTGQNRLQAWFVKYN